MILLADCGSTKTKWAVSADGKVRLFMSSGVNPLMTGRDVIKERFEKEMLPNLDGKMPDEIYFYGAGCASSEICRTVSELLSECSGCSKVYVASDLLGAARSLCGREKGIACILGTGANSCLFDGTDIAEHVPPLGYVLGDEGSGAVIGRLLVGNVLKNQLPRSVVDSFFSRYQLNAADIITRVYREPEANKFLASFMPFVAENISVSEIRDMVCGEFVRFLRRNVMQYTGVFELPVYFTGSVAARFAEQLHCAADICGLGIARIEADPMPGLIEYHLSGNYTKSFCR